MRRLSSLVGTFLFLLKAKA